jgi:hypothetical protein
MWTAPWRIRELHVPKCYLTSRVASFAKLQHDVLSKAVEKKEGEVRGFFGGLPATVKNGHIRAPQQGSKSQGTGTNVD